jgi:hypothetical protein
MTMDDLAVDEEQRACASCGALLRPDARFCASCGNWIGATALVEEQPLEEAPVVAEVPVEEQPEDDHPGTFEAWRELEELRSVEDLPAPDELDELELPDEIEEITELHSMTPPHRPGVQPVSLSREPMTLPRRVLLAVALLLLFGAIAVALRTGG